MQQALDYQKQQQMAQALMDQQPDMKTPYAGLAQGGGSLLGALTMKDAQNNAMQNYQNNQPGTMHDTGGWGMVSDKAPNLPAQSSWFKNLFSLGGRQ